MLEALAANVTVEVNVNLRDAPDQKLALEAFQVNLNC